MLEIHGVASRRPRLDLRQKLPINPRHTDLQIFRSLPVGDPWVDAQLPSVFLYLHKIANVPDGWHAPMDSLREEMEKYVSRLHVFVTDQMWVVLP